MDPKAVDRIIKGEAAVVRRFSYRQALVYNVPDMWEGNRDGSYLMLNRMERYYMRNAADNHTVCVVELDGQQYAIWFHDFVTRIAPVSALHIERY